MPKKEAAKPVKNQKSAAKVRPAVDAKHPLRTGEETILAALEEKTTLDFVDTPFQEVVAYIQDMHHIAINLDMAAFKDAGIDPAAPVNFSISGVPLRSALRLMLSELKLEWTVWCDVLFITTPEKAESDAFIVTKVYDVTDLILETEDKPYRGSGLPTVAAVEPEMTMRARGATSGGMGGFDTPANVREMRALTDMVTATIATKTWADNGGTGTLYTKGNLLCVSQTFQTQCEVKALLAALRAKRRAAPTVTVEFQELWLDAEQYAQLLGGGGKPSSDGRVPLAVDANVLDAFARKVPGFRGRIVCANGQLVHVASGDRRSIIVNTIPVVGSDVSSVGYSPVVQVPNAGVVVEVRATVAPGGTTAKLDVQSIVTRWGKPQPTAHIGEAWPARQITEGTAGASGSVIHRRTSLDLAGSGTCPVERPVLPTQELATTVRVPLGKPVVLGGMTFAPTDSAGLDKPADNPLQLYLIATTSIATP